MGRPRLAGEAIPARRTRLLVCVAAGGSSVGLNFFEAAPNVGLRQRLADVVDPGVGELDDIFLARSGFVREKQGFGERGRGAWLDRGAGDREGRRRSDGPGRERLGHGGSVGGGSVGSARAGGARVEEVNVVGVDLIGVRLVNRRVGGWKLRRGDGLGGEMQRRLGGCEAGRRGGGLGSSGRVRCKEIKERIGGVNPLA